MVYSMILCNQYWWQYNTMLTWSFRDEYFGM